MANDRQQIGEIMGIDISKLSELDNYELNAAVAEHLMGMERGDCYGTVGGGCATGSGWQQEVHTWFNCQWCGRLVEDDQNAPCCRYPFPEIGVLQIMEALGERQLHALVRYDPLRESKRWTVAVSQSGQPTNLSLLLRADTNDPLRALRIQGLKALARLSEIAGVADDC
jgi:hypothetical protein